MTAYECTVCSNKDDGKFHFYVLYDHSVAVKATRCPRCGELESSVDVKEL